jgi:hypothetical protein
MITHEHTAAGGSARFHRHAIMFGSLNNKMINTDDQAREASRVTLNNHSA